MGSLRRLVYSPKAWVYVKTQNHGVFDCSNFVVSGEVNRLVNEVSSATITLRNSPQDTHGKLSHYGRFTINPFAQIEDEDAVPIFHPMDPITIYLARYPDRPVQSFTGFLDTTPYVQLFPGTITLKASCTLKRLLYTFWDPALPFTRDFLAEFGWLSDVSSGQLINLNATVKQLDQQNPHLTDSGFGELLYAVLNRVGGWRDDQIHIEKLPDGIIETVTGIYNSFLATNEDAEQQFSELLSRMIGTGASGSAGGNPSGPAGSSSFGALGGLKFTDGQQRFAATLAPLLNYDIRVIGAWMYQEENGSAADQRERDSNHDWLNINVNGSFHLPSPVANTPEAAAKWSYDWIIGKSSPHGDASTIKQPILSASGKSAQAQLQALATSAWCAPNYDVTGLTKIFNMISVKHDAANSPAHTGQGSLDPTSADPQNQKTSTQKKTKGNAQAGVGAMADYALPIPSKYIPTKLGGHDSRLGSLDRGVDIEGYPHGNPIYAIADGTVHTASLSGFNTCGDGIYPVLELDTPIAVNKNTYRFVYYGHCYGASPYNGKKVKAGEVIGKSGCTATNPGHIEIGYAQNAAGGIPSPQGSPPHEIAAIPGEHHYHPQSVDMWNFLQTSLGHGAYDPSGAGVTIGGGSGSTTSTNSGNVLATATASAFATSIEFPGIEETIEAIALQGQKSLMNDKPLLPFIQQLAGASLRHFMSLPNGSIIAFYPDFFGTYGHRAPYWEIDDIEILDGKIELSDDALATHVYVVGDTFPFIGGPGQLVNKLASGGVVTVFNAFNAGDWMIEGGKSALGSADIPKASQGKGKKDRKRGEQKPITEVQNINSKKSIFGDTGKALAFLQKFGARPLYQEEPFIRSPYFEAFMAFTLFQLAWSKQFLTTFSLTFMPELYPGGRVFFKNHGFACYIDAVTHSFDYTGGFSTSVNFSAPSAYTQAVKPGDPPTIERNPIAQGMIRSL